MADTLSLPILRELIPSGIDYGSSLLVEFEPDSIWFEMSLNLAAHALMGGIRTDYHSFQHMPAEISQALSRFGLKVEELQDDDALRIIDSYTIQTGLGTGTQPEKGRVPGHYSQSLKLADWSIANLQRIKSGVPEGDKRRLHIDDNTGVLLQYNEEKAFIDNWRTRHRPHTKVQEIVLFNSLMVGAGSEAFTGQFELLSEGIIDLKSEEIGGEIRHSMRVRMMRGKKCDSRWRQLELLDGREIQLVG